MTKLVIIEGPDNTGKTTVINELMSKYNNVYYIHCQKPSNVDDALAAAEQSQQFIKICLQICDLVTYANPEIIILDRSWFGEYVYGCKYRNNDKDYVINMINTCLNLLKVSIKHNDLIYCPILLTVDNPEFCIKHDDGCSLSEANLLNISDEINRFNEIAEIFNINKVIVNDGLNFRKKENIFNNVTNIINQSNE